jgi:tetratricopeptide (TPR) repeat protein
VIEARAYFDRSAQCRAGDHESEMKTNESYRKRFAFTHYFRALIHKSWEDLSEAQHEIEQSAKHLEGPGEFLTPVTKAEILSYIVGDESRCQTLLQELIERMDNVEAALKNDGKALDANQLRLRVRILVLYGNTYFEQRRFEEALTKYTMALKYSPSDYYALASAAQCYSELGDSVAAAAHFRQSLEAIERSGDFRKKRERTTRAVIAVIAANAAKRCNDAIRWEQYDRDARDLLGGILDVDGLSPKFFSPSSKRLVNATDLLKELDMSGARKQDPGV